MRQPSIDNIYFRPAIPLLFAFISGIVAGNHFPGGFFPAAIFAVFCTSVLIYNICRNKTARISPLFLFCCLGYLALQFWTAPSFSAGHIVHSLDNIPRRIGGTVAEEPVKRNRRTYLYLNVHTLEENGNALPAEGKIRVTLMGDKLNLKKGDHISFASRIRSIRNFNNPGGFDYERFMAFKQIHGSAYAREDRVDIIGSSESKNSLHFIAPLRGDISRLIESRASAETAGVLKALLVGDKTDMAAETRNAFNRLGLGHLLAISGLHIGIVATLAFMLFQRLFSMVPYFVTRARVTKAAAIGAIFPVLLYGLISGMSPSTQRAVIMVCVFLAAFLVEKEQNPLNSMAVAALAILIYNPPSLFSISFQLSFAAVTFILLGIRHIHTRFAANTKGVRKWANRLIVFLSVSFLAILGTLPLVMHYFNLFSFMGLPANCFAVPLIGFMAVPVGLLAVFCYPFSQPLATLGVDLASAILDPGVRLILSLSEYDFVSATTITPSVVEICCYYLLFLGILFIRKHRGIKIILAGVVLVLVLDMSYWAHHRWFSDEFRVTALDVGQGSAVLLEFPKGYTMMIDGGGFSDNASFDVGERIVAPYLLRNKIKTVDTLVLSHPNADHLNGLIHIADNFNVKTVWTNGQKADTLGYKTLMAVIKQNNINAPEFQTLSRTHVINTVEIKILHPSRDFNPDGILAAKKGTNDNSIVIKARFGATDFLFPGDITTPGERDLIASSGGALSADVLFSPHHGSKSSSSTNFLDGVDPGYVIISAGWKNRFRFPHPSVLKKYRDRGSVIFRTDLNGAIRVVSNGKALIFKRTIISGGKQPFPS